MATLRVIFLLTIVILMAVHYHAHERDDTFAKIDKSDWVDPTDMISDFSKQLRDKKRRNEETVNAQPPIEPPHKIGNVKCETSQGLLQHLRAHIEELIEKEPPDTRHSLTDILDKLVQSGIIVNSTPTLDNKCNENGDIELFKEKLQDCEKQLQRLAAPEKPFFRQFVTNLLSRMDTIKHQVELEGELLVNVVMLVSEQSLEDLRQFSEGGAVQDAHSALISNILDVHESEPRPNLATASFEWVLENVNIVCIMVSTICLVVITLSLQMHNRIRLSWALLWKLFIIIFILSIPWNWWHLYKLEAAKRYADMLQQMPPDCKPKHEQSLWEALKESFSLDVDACTRYHQRIMTDPFWEVPPTKALAVTFTKFAVEPFEHIGTALNLFLQKTLTGLPVYLWPVALFFSILMLLLALVMSFGYRINLFHLLGLEPPQQRPALQALEDENRRLRDDVAKHQRQIEDLKIDKLTLQGRLDERRLQINPLIPPPSYHRDARSGTHTSAITLGSGHTGGYDQQYGSESFVYVDGPIRPSKDGAIPFFDDDVLPPDDDRELHGASAQAAAGDATGGAIRAPGLRRRRLDQGDGISTDETASSISSSTQFTLTQITGDGEPGPLGARPFTTDESQQPNGARELHDATVEQAAGSASVGGASYTAPRFDNDLQSEAATIGPISSVDQLTGNRRRDTTTRVDRSGTSLTSSCQSNNSHDPRETAVKEVSNEVDTVRHEVEDEQSGADGHDRFPVPETVQPGDSELIPSNQPSRTPHLPRSTSEPAQSRHETPQAPEPAHSSLGPVHSATEPALDDFFARNPSNSSGPPSVTTHAAQEEDQRYDPDERGPVSTSAAIQCASAPLSEASMSRGEPEENVDVENIDCGE